MRLYPFTLLRAASTQWICGALLSGLSFTSNAASEPSAPLGEQTPGRDLYRSVELELQPGRWYPVAVPERGTANITDALVFPASGGRDAVLVFRNVDSKTLLWSPLPSSTVNDSSEWSLTRATEIWSDLSPSASLTLAFDAISSLPYILASTPDGRRLGIAVRNENGFVFYPLPAANELASPLADLNNDQIPDRLTFDPTTNIISKLLTGGSPQRWLKLPEDFKPIIAAPLIISEDLPVAPRGPDLLAIDGLGRWCIASSVADGSLNPCEIRSGYKGGTEVPTRWRSPTVRRRAHRPPELLLYDPDNRLWALATPTLAPLTQLRWLGSTPYGIDRFDFAVGDMNGDDELLIAGRDARFAFVLQSTPSSSEVELRGAVLPTDDKQAINLADITGDGLADLSFFSAAKQSMWVAVTVRRQLPGPASAGPRVCHGFNPGSRQSWGRLTSERCPEGYAILEVDDASRSRVGGLAGRSIGGLCCPLPASDILTDKLSTHSDSCPEDAVAVGADVHNGSYSLVCARINMERYELGPSMPGRYWGMGFSKPIDDSSALNKHSLPIGLRFGAGRRTLRTWDPDGCVGRTPGALYTSRAGEACNGFAFRELYYRGGKNRVQLLPECTAIGGLFSPQAECITPKRATKSINDDGDNQPRKRGPTRWKMD